MQRPTERPLEFVVLGLVLAGLGKAVFPALTPDHFQDPLARDLLRALQQTCLTGDRGQLEPVLSWLRRCGLTVEQETPLVQAIVGHLRAVGDRHRVKRAMERLQACQLQSGTFDSFVDAVASALGLQRPEEVPQILPLLDNNLKAKSV